MQVNTVITRKVVLELSEEEAEWLHAVMQNPIWNPSAEEELLKDSTMRQRFFAATTFRT